jgi:phage terminase large subunit-like protein
MSLDLKPLTPEQISKLTDEEQSEYLEHLEALYYNKGKSSFLHYYTNIELPGAPMSEPEPEVYYSRKLDPAAHHLVIIDAIQKLADGTWHDVDGIIALAPPGSAKSTVLSVGAASWLIGRRPGTNVVGGSYGQDLANRFGRRVRTVVRSEPFEKMMGCTISADNQAVDNWSTTAGSDYRAAGMGAAVTGFRADYVLIDDPIKGREEADSEVIREKVWNALNDDFLTRLKPGGKLIMLLTHWHEDDPAGRLLGEEWKGQSGFWRATNGKLYYVINLPIFAEHKDDPLGRKPGEMLWPEWYKRSEIELLEKQAQKGGTAARTWASLYQQRPAPAEGSILLRSYWQKWTKPQPPECSFVMLSYDTAFEDGEENDYSAMTAWGIFEAISSKRTGEQYNHHHVILLGGWRDKVLAADLADIIQEHYKFFKPDLILVEKRASGIQVLQELKRLRLPVRAWLPRGKPGRLGKIPRAHGVAMMLEQGAVHYFPGKITDQILAECATFPNGSHDDWVDATTMSLAYFRDRFMFKTADDEMDAEEQKQWLNEQLSNSRPRALYSGQPTRRGQNERRIQDEATDSMTPETKRRLYNHA